MKISLLLLTFLLSSSLWAMEKIPLITGKIYLPAGYDDNDLVEVAVSGRLPDLCHRNPTYEFTRVGNNFEIQLYAYYVPLPEGCKNISIPFLDTITLGVLKKGSYSVKLRGVDTRQTVQQFKVAQASSSLRDDFLYGNVMGVIENDNNRQIELIGTNPVNCLMLKSLETEVQEGIIVLRPKFEERSPCKNRPSSFSIKYEVPYLSNQPRGILLHVRVMDGRSFNYLYQNRL